MFEACAQISKGREFDDSETHTRNIPRNIAANSTHFLLVPCQINWRFLKPRLAAESARLAGYWLLAAWMFDAPTDGFDPQRVSSTTTVARNRQG